VGVIQDGRVPPVIPGKTEKMGHFFSFDPESTAAEVGKCPHFRLIGMTWVDGTHPSRPSANILTRLQPVDIYQSQPVENQFIRQP